MHMKCHKQKLMLMNNESVHVYNYCNYEPIVCHEE